MENQISKQQLFNKLGATLRSYTMQTRSGKGYSPNQQIVVYEGGRAFFSYNTLIAVWCCGHLYLTWYHDYSNTTIRYCNEFSGLTTQERRKAIETGAATYIEE